MKTLAKATAFLLVGVFLSPIMLGLFAPYVFWGATESVLYTLVFSGAVWGVWCFCWDWMLKRGWHNQLS